MRFRFFALAASVLAIAGCADTTQLPAAPDDLRLSASDESNGVVQSVSGTADIDVPEGLRRLQISAQKRADGAVSGKFTVRQEWVGGFQLEGDVTCFTIVENRAYVGAVLTSTDGVPTPDYQSVRIILIDNGEGSAVPDQSNRLIVTPELNQPQTFCNNANLVQPMYDLARGNLQIRP